MALNTGSIGREKEKSARRGNLLRLGKKTDKVSNVDTFKKIQENQLGPTGTFWEEGRPFYPQT